MLILGMVLAFLPAMFMMWGAIDTTEPGPAEFQNTTQLFLPGLVFAAWAIFATEALGANVQWISTPLALALLVDVELARLDLDAALRQVRGDESPLGEGRLAGRIQRCSLITFRCRLFLRQSGQFLAQGRLGSIDYRVPQAGALGFKSGYGLF